MATKAEQKAELVDLLIENTELSGFSEDDREDLETMSLGGLQRCVDLAELTAEIVENAGYEDSEEDMAEDEAAMKKARKGKKGKKGMTKNSARDDDEDEDEEEEAPTRNSKKKPAKKPKQVSVLQTNSAEDDEEEQVFNEEDQASIDEYIENAPAGYRDMIQNGIKSFENQKKQLVEVVMNCETNIFEKAWLVQQPMDVLRGLHALTQNNRRSGRGNYVGAAGAAPASSPIRNAEEEGLALPTMNFSKN